MLFAPPVTALALIALGFWPSARAALGGQPDHCEAAVTQSPHLCWLHTAGAPTGMPHDAAVIVLVVLLAVVGAWHAFHWGQALGRLRLLQSTAVPEREAEVRAALAEAGIQWPVAITVVSFERPLCYVVGVRRPQLMISTAVLDELSAADLRIILAHEAAHLARRDNLWRLIAQFGLLFHLPGLGRRTFHRWASTTEAACDEAAAKTVGSRVAVAEALVHFERLAQRRGTTPSLGAAFGGENVLEARVHLLLDAPVASRWQRVLGLAPWLALGIASWQADALHRGLEGLLFLLHL
ncbi:Protease HtpX [compost metagenome]